MLFKRLLALNDLGCSLLGRDGHIWVEENDTNNDGDSVSLLSMVLEKGGVSLNNKIYGGILQALDTVDEALKLAGSKNLIDYYDENSDRIFFGNPGVENSRIRVNKKGIGGVV